MDLVIRAAAAFGVIFIFTRLLGRRQLSQMQPFDLILLVIVGDLIQQGVTQNDFSVTGLILVITTVAVLQTAVTYVNFRFRRVRKIVEGEPVVVIQDGKYLDKNMQRERITREDIEEEARLSEIASLSEVRWGVLETSGRISFIKKGG
jgi:uncharacterized membrane protein YcaP (DUF421 family)